MHRIRTRTVQARIARAKRDGDRHRTIVGTSEAPAYGSATRARLQPVPGYPGAFIMTDAEWARPS